ncbi:MULTISPECIES: SAM domain-containing protein [unclassified Mesorhizobium]|uniref:SAM domain-containing protein n=1 Tax=unclassified Mesorhizobium TaxID=325217 RepID=UPI003334DDD9
MQRGRSSSAPAQGRADAFIDNDIDPAILPRLSDDDLRELGIKSVGHRKKILTAIAELSHQADQPLPASEAATRNAHDGAAPNAKQMRPKGGTPRPCSSTSRDRPP